MSTHVRSSMYTIHSYSMYTTVPSLQMTSCNVSKYQNRMLAGQILRAAWHLPKSEYDQEIPQSYFVDQTMAS